MKKRNTAGFRIMALPMIDSTDAPLKSGKPFKKDFCKNCDLCIKTCPVGAIDQDGNVDVMKCARENMKLGLPGVTQFVKGWVGASDDEKKDMLKNPTFCEI